MRWIMPRVIVCVLAGLLVSGSGLAEGPVQELSFAGRIAALSEQGGYFDTDNLISNERTYLSVLPDLERAGVRGGAYLGVGPDQNFSYIAAIRPDVAIIVDIRRDNLLLHLLFKALFAHSRTRVEYLAQLCGRPVPEPVEEWHDRGVEDIVAYVDDTAVDPAGVEALRARLTATMHGFGVPLSMTDQATIDRFHRRFIEAGLSLRFQSTGRAPQWHYPTLRDLVLAEDDAGRQANYLASESSFQFVKALQARDRIIPVIGNLSGPKALGAIGGFLRAQQLPLSAFYVSNVEFYLWREGTYGPFIDNLGQLPHAANAVVIRSLFGGGGSISEVEPVGRMLDRALTGSR
jgi:hypothetical protein